MLVKFKYLLTVLVISLGLMQSANASVVFSSFGTTGDFSITEEFFVEAGLEYEAKLTDVGTVALPVFDNFDGLSLVIFDESFAVVGAPLLLTPASESGYTSAMFSFVAAEDAIYSIAVAGTTDALSTYTAVVSQVPVPPAFLLLGSALLGLVSIGKRNA